MKIEKKALPESRIELTITLPWEDWQKYLNQAAQAVGREANIPGFRSGNIPRNILEQRYGKAALLGEAAEQAVRHSYPEALKKEKIEALDEPEIHLEQLIEGEPFMYRAVTAVMPEVKLGRYTKAVQAINREFEKGSDEVEEADIATELVKLAEMRASLVMVNRPAANGDSALLDFEVRQDGVPIENGTSKNHALVLGKGAFIPGFEENITGMRAGEEKTFTITFPEKYHVAHLAGKPAEFHVRVNAVQERRIPAIDEAFAKSLGNFESLEKVKESLRQGMRNEKQAKRKEERRTAILDAIVAETEAELPAVLLKEEEARMMRDFEHRAESMGMGVKLDDLLVQMKKTREDLVKEWAPQSRKRILAELAMEKIATEEAITVESKEIEEEMNKTLQLYRSEKDLEKIDMERLYDGVRFKLRNEKTFEFLESL